MTELPIDASLPRIIEALAGRSLVVVAPPGSGKTTRVPPAILRGGLLSADHPGVIVLQPRRVAARAAAARIAQEQGWTLGEEVGYQVRFERRFSPQTRLRFLTEGILTRQLLDDPFLDSVGAVVLDEFHERNLNSDLALALLREVRREVRPDLILVVMSATLDAEPVARFLDDCPIVRAEGRSYEVVHRIPPARPAGERPRPGTADRRADHRSQIQRTHPGLSAGHGRDRASAETARARRGPRRRPRVAASRVAAGRRPGPGTRAGDRRKVILSTNVAETSLTIDGVTTVIDTGLARIVRYDAERGIDRWELARISRAAGRPASRPGRSNGAWPLHPPLVRTRTARPGGFRTARDPSRRPVRHRARTPRLGHSRPGSVWLV